jgi:hypothetical protein
MGEKSMEKDTTAVLQKYVADTGVRSVQKVEIDFDRIAHALPAQDLTNGLSEAFRSEQTPAFEQLLGQSFEQGDAEQRAAVLNHLLDAAGPAAMQTLLEKGVLPEPIVPGSVRALAMTTEQAGRLRPETVQEIAYVAHCDDPAVIDRISNHYAGNPALAKTLGGAALNVALEKIAHQR